MTDLDRRIRKIAQRQHGLVTGDDARDVGCSRHTVQHRLATGQWELVAPKVYRVAGSVPTWHQQLMGTVLAAAPGAAASHNAAAALWGMPAFEPGPLEVTKPAGGNHRASLGVVHQSKRLLPADVTTVAGVPVTRAAWTLLDLAGQVHPRRLERMVDDSLATNLTKLKDLRAVVARFEGTGRAGQKALSDLVDERGPGYVPPASELEARLLEVLADGGLPPPTRQAALGGRNLIGRVDFAYPDARLVIEADSRRHHTSVSDRRTDRHRDNRLAADGWRVQRVYWEDLRSAPDEVVAWVRTALAQGRGQNDRPGPAVLPTTPQGSGSPGSPASPAGPSGSAAPAVPAGLTPGGAEGQPLRASKALRKRSVSRVRAVAS